MGDDMKKIPIDERAYPKPKPLRMCIERRAPPPRTNWWLVLAIHILAFSYALRFCTACGGTVDTGPPYTPDAELYVEEDANPDAGDPPPTHRLGGACELGYYGRCADDETPVCCVCASSSIGWQVDPGPCGL